MWAVRLSTARKEASSGESRVVGISDPPGLFPIEQGVAACLKLLPRNPFSRPLKRVVCPPLWTAKQTKFRNYRSVAATSEKVGAGGRMDDRSAPPSATTARRFPRRYTDCERLRSQTRPPRAAGAAPCDRAGGQFAVRAPARSGLDRRGGVARRALA